MPILPRSGEAPCLTNAAPLEPIHRIAQAGACENHAAAAADLASRPHDSGSVLLRHLIRIPGEDGDLPELADTLETV